MGKVIDWGGWLRGFVPALWHLLSHDQCSPHIASIQPPDPPPPPPSSCLWPIIIALPLLAMCWESKGSHLSLIRMEPHQLLPRALNHNQLLGRQRWIGTSTTLYLTGSPPPPSKGCCHRQIIEVILRRSVQVKSAAPGRKLSQSDGGTFFSL